MPPIAIAPYRHNALPSLPGSDRIYLDAELGRIERSLSGLSTAATSFYSLVIINVRDYGAVGDGRTDDRAAIQAAIDYAATLGDSRTRAAATVYLPPGTYRISAAIVLTALGLTLKGAGRQATSILLDNTADDCIRVSPGQLNVAVCDLTLIGGCNVDTVFTLVPCTAGYAIYSDANTHGFRVENVVIDNFYNGIYMGGTNGMVLFVKAGIFYGQYLLNDSGGATYVGFCQFDSPDPAVMSQSSGYTVWAPSTAYALHSVVSANGYWFGNTQAGTSASGGGGPVVHGFYQDIADGTAKWQIMCKTDFIKYAGLGGSSFVYASDISGPCTRAVYLAGGGTTTVTGNTIDAVIGHGVEFAGSTQFNHVVDNYIGLIVNASGSPGRAINDATGTAPMNTIRGNIINGPKSEAIYCKSNLWTIQGNTIGGTGNGGTTSFGIVLTNSATNCNISNNMIPSNGLSGSIQVTLGCTKYIVTNNNVDGIAVSDLGGAVSKTVTGNI